MEKIVTNILIVDDVEANLISLRAILKSPELVIHEADSGNAALKILMKEDIDMVLLDVQMPDINGFEVAELMRAHDKTKDIPIIFITAINKEDSYVFKGYELGAVDYLYKPINSDILRSKVNVFVKLQVQAKIIEARTEELKRKIVRLEEAEKELHKLTRTDQLTGISNRRGFDENLELEWRRAIRNESVITLLLIDIDYFKNFNDTYGHVEGDECLRKVAESISQSLHRPFDHVARYGGEEFAVLLPETDTEGGLRIAETIRKDVENLKIENKLEGLSEVVTISIGIASMKPTLDSKLDEFVEKADCAMYESKLSGRNKSSVFGENPI